jgi:hypothetical protein
MLLIDIAPYSCPASPAGLIGKNCRARASALWRFFSKSLIRIYFIFVADSLAESDAQEPRQSCGKLDPPHLPDRPTLPIWPRQIPPRSAHFADTSLMASYYFSDS